MSSAGNQPASPGPSVFISYASEDRMAARALRDYLTGAGLDVWYDENELGGGEAWDRKIRQQIRDCEYFMPVISAETERRKEGYFRREWRLACERTLDMADDVLFLLPIAIDATSETGARVPEKFLSVQWLRAPNGQATPSLEALARRLLAGEHTALPRPPSMARTPLVPPHLVNATQAPWSGTPSASNSPHAGSAPPAPPPVPPVSAHHDDAPPPMPAFPHAPEKGGIGHWFKFFAEMVWWVITAAWVLLTRMPKWGRVLVAAWVLFSVIGTCSGPGTRSSRDRDRGSDDERENPVARRKKAPPPPVAPDLSVNGEQVKAAIEAARQAVVEAGARDGKAPDFGRMGAELARRFGKSAIDPSVAGKPLVIVPFETDPADAAAATFTAAVFAAVHEKLRTARPEEVGVTGVTLGHATDEALGALGRNLGARLTLGARVGPLDGVSTLSVRLIRMPTASVAWAGDYPIAGSDPADVAAKITEGVLAVPPPAPRKQ